MNTQQSKHERLVNFRGFKLPEGVVVDIKQATQAWKERDKKAWEFAKRAARVVGRYIPEATKALAFEMGTTSVSTPEGYAKAWALRCDLQAIRKPFFEELYISHYITVGKSYGAGKIDLDQAFEILHHCVQENLSVESLRALLAGRMGGDDWATSAERLQEQIERQLINAPFTGVDETKAAVVALLGKGFLKVIQWALQGSKPVDFVRPEVQAAVDHLEATVQEDQEEVAPNWERAAEAIQAVQHRRENEHFHK